jgi:hypothetical protein
MIAARSAPGDAADVDDAAAAAVDTARIELRSCYTDAGTAWDAAPE